MEEIIVLNKKHKDKEIERLNNRLEELTAEMNQFSYIVSHDLQAPLRTITGFLDLLERRYGDKLDDSAKQYIGHVIKGAGKMKDLIFDLLEYSRINTADLEKTEVDLNEVINEIKEKFTGIIKENGIKIKLGKLPVVTANKKQMNQLFEHVFENAVKFRREILPEINIDAKNENGFWIFCTEDNGIGIDPSFFEKIFIIFRKLNTDEIKYPGTGIGLTICKKIVELHKGKMWLESAVNKGSRFYFSIPGSK